MQKHAFFVHQIITPFIYHVSLSQKFSYAKKIVCAMLKKEERKISIPKGIREKKEMDAKEHEEKKRKRKKEIR